ncbi:MAG: RluA family pseudouridine synthase [Desulfovibrio sp.]|nr:RluA family pseudouridine synthase [Desulfovibrio sp.]
MTNDLSFPHRHHHSPELSPCVRVHNEESGQKLLQFLQRRLHLPSTLLHRWIRSGQIRRNASRCKPFERIETDDVIRLPPFARSLSPDTAIPTKDFHCTTDDDLPPIIGKDGNLWALNKPAGLPVQPGSGHDDCISTRLAARFPLAHFSPTPVHRLDKDTSGILLTAFSYQSLIFAQEALRHGNIAKEYIVWVHGCWPYPDVRLLRHHLHKTSKHGYEKVRIAPSAAEGREALCIARPLRICARESLLQIRLLTGRTHQIRVQLAAFGHPVLGDSKYGSQDHRLNLFLHAACVMLPNGHIFSCLPPWEGRYALEKLPVMLDTSTVVI